MDFLFIPITSISLEVFLKTKPENVLYLTDNAGEIYFDMPLYEYLKKHCGRIYLVVKGGPSLNDLTRVELQSQKLIGRFDIVADTGTDGAGIDWDNVSREFIDLVASADLIVSKGMANFETLYPKRICCAKLLSFQSKMRAHSKLYSKPRPTVSWLYGKTEMLNPNCF